MTRSFEIQCAGYAIMADWYEGESTDQVILILQGFTSSRQRQEKFTNYMSTATGASALVIDYTGHGESPYELKDTRPAQHVLEVVYAFEWIKQHYPDAKITVIGNSYGSFLATHLTHYKSFEKLVLRAPAIYRPQAFYDLWSVRFKDEDAYRESIQQYRNDPDALKSNPLLVNANAQFMGPTLVVAHELDQIIPRTTSDAYVEAFNADTFVAEGFSHAVSESDITEQQIDAYHERIAQWLRLS